jgi:hypothetical protein
LRFFHQGEFEGRKKRISPHLGRGPNEPINERIERFYERMLRILQQPILGDGSWQTLECVSAWDGNWTNDCFVAFAWQCSVQQPLVVVVNYAPNQSQCHVRLPISGLAGKKWRLEDLLNGHTYDWNGDDLAGRGLYVDQRPWQAALLALQPA